MSEFTYNIDQLSTSLPIDKTEAQRLSHEHRSMEDLKEGLTLVNRDMFLTNALHGTTDKAWETPDSVRHINRGIATTSILLGELMTRSESGDNQAFQDAISLEWPSDDKQRQKDQLQRVREELEESRRQVCLGEKWGLSAQEHEYDMNKFKAQVDQILNGSHILEAVETAVQNLDGPGLEEPTDPDDAKYGAAVLMLNLARLRA